MLGIKWFKKKRIQHNLLLTEDSRILDVPMPVLKGYLVEHKTAEAWGLVPNSRIADRDTGRLYQILTERDCAPMSLNSNNNSKKLKEMIPKIAGEQAAQARADIQRESERNKLVGTLQLLLIVLGITVGVVVIFGLFMSGKVHFPGSGGGGSIFSGLPAVLCFLIPMWIHRPKSKRRKS